MESNKKINVLLVGSGGREHAMTWSLANSRRIGNLYCAPGNGGTSQVAENIQLADPSINGLVKFAESYDIGLTVVGPEDWLAAGIASMFRVRGLTIFGPNQDAAKLESSKVFAKEIMTSSGIPTAGYASFTGYQNRDACSFINKHHYPLVVKVDGLALGKGVYICNTQAEAEKVLDDIMNRGVHGGFNRDVVIENYLAGQEISIHAFCDGKTAVLFPPAQDHKPIGDGDSGPNTGGMGTIAPVPWVTPGLMKTVNETIVQPTLSAMSLRGTPYTGLLYPGLKITDDGPKVLEYNVRFGDPETQSYMRLLKTDLLEILLACADGTLDQISVEWNGGYAVCVVLASGGYPDSYQKGFPITGIDQAESVPGVVVFHAGTKYDGETLVTSGGRVLGVTAIGDTLQAALDRAYEGVSYIHFEGMQFRRDIGAKSL